MRGKVKYQNLSTFERKKFLGEFYSIIAQLKTREEVKNFFKDLLTLSEVVMLSRRIQSAQLLLQGETHENIRKKLKVGFGTIAAVEHWLRDGFGGYKEMIERYKKKYGVKKWDGRGDFPYSFKWLRKKYPLHFLLLNLISKDK
jgi:TrpR-related protein YerC/YecD